MVEFRCPSCGTALADNLVKCPSCGLPLKPQGASTSNRSLFAAFLLLSMFAVGALIAVVFIMNPDLAIQPNTTFPVGSFDVMGHATDSNGTRVANATVILDASHNATTDAEGAFRVENVPFGVYELNVTKDNRTALVRLGVRDDVDVNATIPAAAGAVKSDHGSLSFFRGYAKVWGGILLGLCAITLAGTVASYRRRAWGLALTGAIAGALLWLPLSLLLGLIAIVLLGKSRSEFR